MIIERKKKNKTYLIIHKCENEHKCRSVRDVESDSENVRLWLCRIDDEVPDVDDDDVVDAFAVVDVVFALVLEDELAVTDVRLLSIFLSELLTKFSYFSFEYVMLKEWKLSEKRLTKINRSIHFDYFYANEQNKMTLVYGNHSCHKLLD